MSTKELTPPPPQLITRKELAARLGVCEATIGRHDKSGAIKGIRVGGSFRYDFNQVLANLPSTAGGRNGK